MKKIILELFPCRKVEILMRFSRGGAKVLVRFVQTSELVVVINY